jgi:hypothetical protein
VFIIFFALKTMDLKKDAELEKLIPNKKAVRAPDPSY